MARADTESTNLFLIRINQIIQKLGWQEKDDKYVHPDYTQKKPKIQYKTNKFCL